MVLFAPVDAGEMFYIWKAGNMNVLIAERYLEMKMTNEELKDKIFELKQMTENVGHLLFEVRSLQVKIYNQLVQINSEVKK